MSEKRCGTCKHYETTNKSCPPPTNWGFCNRIGRISQSDINHSDPEDHHGRAYTISSQRSNLICKPDFGCVLWEPKSPEERPAGD